MAPGHAAISGGSSGIGLALARRLAGEGWNLSILARDPDRLERARASIEEFGRGKGNRVATFATDVRDQVTTENAVADAITTFGSPDLLIASAGIVIPGLFAALPAAAFREQIDVNYFGALHLIRAGLPSMQAQKKGRIVLISSGAGLMGLYGYSAYAPSKFAVRGLAEALRAELRLDSIGVSVVYPPDTDTPQLREERGLRPAALEAIAAGSRVLTADAVASAILSGIRRKRFVIAPGRDMAVLAFSHSLIGPLLNHFWFDRVAARLHARRPMKRP